MTMHHPAIRSNPVSEEDFCRWLGQARPGETLAYHRGHLVLDCAEPPGCSTTTHRSALRRLARRARSAAEMGLVHLLQQRHGPDDYTYLAVARMRPKTNFRLRPNDPGQ